MNQTLYKWTLRALLTAWTLAAIASLHGCGNASHVAIVADNEPVIEAAIEATGVVLTDWCTVPTHLDNNQVSVDVLEGQDVMNYEKGTQTPIVRHCDE